MTSLQAAGTLVVTDRQKIRETLPLEAPPLEGRQVVVLDEPRKLRGGG
jgi:hypothetical protein